MNIILLGAPGAGKGTQAAFLTEHYTLTLVGTGDMFRKAISEGTDLGKKADAYVQSGQLVPDALVFDIIQENLKIDDWHRGLLFDGFPRTIEQAKELEKIVSAQKTVIDNVVFVSVNDEVLIDRLVNRWTCAKCKKIYGKQAVSTDAQAVCAACGGTLTKRADDNPETVKKRLVEYKQKTEPILDYFGSKVLRVDGSLTIEEVTKGLIAAIGN